MSPPENEGSAGSVSAGDLSALVWLLVKG